ncbi:hypothetical protein K435DRAFT_797016 [Dendrothele bispora CBS 962.96]|uniref:Uncharacterized protein n=1 Tax=Dendrothele bispora (strain CBS 962.96) TaxID=1314807 RepID=A0A4S8M4F6_DENBC|nr:hypothetical protein K435DRAFT_797016 [Dendrothele bispora CBS 962.96]
MTSLMLGFATLQAETGRLTAFCIMSSPTIFYQEAGQTRKWVTSHFLRAQPFRGTSRVLRYVVQGLTQPSVSAQDGCLPHAAEWSQTQQWCCPLAVPPSSETFGEVFK